MTRWALWGTSVVGAFTAFGVRARFGAGPVVLAQGCARLVVRGYPSERVAEGDVLDAEEWRNFVRVGQGTDIDPMDSEPHLTCWAVRRSLSERLHLILAAEERGALRHRIERAEGSILLVDAREEEAARRVVAKEGLDRARASLLAGGQIDPISLATESFEIAPAMDPATIAVLVAAHRRVGNAERAESYLAMARNSRGVEFNADIERVLRELPAKEAS